MSKKDNVFGKTNLRIKFVFLGLVANSCKPNGRMVKSVKGAVNHLRYSQMYSKEVVKWPFCPLKKTQILRLLMARFKDY